MKDGFEMFLTLGTQARCVRIMTRIDIIMGDGKSGDTLCYSRTPHYKQAHTCRGCCTPFMDLSVERMAKDCNWVAQEDQRVLLVGCQPDGK